MKNIKLFILIIVVALCLLSPATLKAESDINAKVAQLDIDNATLDDVIRIFGEPTKYIWGKETFTKDNLPSRYIASYTDGFSVFMFNGQIDELRFSRPGAGYVFKDKLQIGSSLNEVLKVVGQPKQTVEGQPNKFVDGVLYKDIDGKKGYCYYSRKDQNVRFFFLNYKVTSLYVTSGSSGVGTNGSHKWRQTALRSLPKYNPQTTDEPFQVDLRSYDLSKLDLKDALNDLLHASFDDKTIWPPLERMPELFNWKQFMELGKNPGLGVRSLHKKGVTGRGVSIAIIDQPLLTTHQEYTDRIKLYEKLNTTESSSTMHGAAVASIAVGKTVGVAPEADLYYIASRTGDWQAGEHTYNFTYYAQAINRILEINKDLPEDRKIRVISMQVGWIKGQAGYEEITDAVEKAKSAGMLVVSSSIDDIHGFKFHGLGRHPSANPDDFESYEPGLWWAKAFYSGMRWKESDRLMVPMDSRTTANFTSPDGYVFYREGGWSWSIPYIAGVYALVAQVDPEITPKRFWLRALRTGRTIKLEHDGKTFTLGRIIDPVALIDASPKK